MDDLKTVISSLCQSDYLSEWILKLKENEVLFSPQRNIRPCIIEDGNTVRSNTWGGLTLLENYCKKGLTNPEVESFIVSLLNESIRLYKSDKEEEPYKKLNSSNVILANLLDIILSKEAFITNTDFPSFVSIYLDGVTSWPFSLVYSMYNAKNILLKADQKKVFEAYKTILENKNEKADYEKYFVVEELIRNNPYDYYEYSKAYIFKECVDKLFFDLGAFYEYTESYTHSEAVDHFGWLKISSQNIDASILNKDIEYFLKSESEILNKIGLCLINLNFSKTQELFFDNIELLFSKESFYADLRCILNVHNTRLFIEQNKTTLTNALSKASFGQADSYRLSLLKNHLAKIYSTNGFDVPFVEEKQDELEFVLNFNKGIYSVSNHRDEDKERIKNTIWDKDIDEAVDVYFQLSKGSRYYKGIVLSAFKDSLLQFYPNNFSNYLGRFDAEFLTSLLYHFSNKNKDSQELLRVVVLKAIELIRTDRSYLESLSALLFAIRKLADSIDWQELEHVVTSIDYKWIEIDDYEDTNNVIDKCINEDAFAYFDLLSFVAQVRDASGILKEAIEYHRKSNGCSKLKSLLAYIYPRLLIMEPQYALSLRDYIFNNLINEENLSYPLLAISHNISEHLLDSVCNRSDFVSYLHENHEKGSAKMGHSRVSQCVFRSFIFEGKWGDLVHIQFSCKQYDIIIDCIRDMNNWIKEKAVSSEGLNRFGNYLSSFASMLETNGIDYSEVDQLIRSMAKFIVISNDFCQTSWDIILLLFQHFKHFFSDDCVELIAKYRKSRKREITRLLEAYFSRYDRYITYEDTLVKVFNMIAVDSSYKTDVKRWKVSLLNKNTSLNSKLI